MVNVEITLPCSFWRMVNMGKKNKERYINREISWLSFNERVLKLATDVSIPLIERVRFLGIFSNNLDEFFKVRVATLQRARKFSSKPIDQMDFNPSETLAEIYDTVLKSQANYEQIFKQLTKELTKENIILIDETKVKKDQVEFIENYFNERVRPFIVPVMLNNKTPFPQLNDKRIYLSVELISKTKPKNPTYALIEFFGNLPRFVILPSIGDKNYVMFIEDVVRFHLKKIFSIFQFDEANAYAIKMTRDAELDIDDDLSKSLVEKMSRSLGQRKKGDYVRINYDAQIPSDFLQFIIRKTKAKDQDNILSGGRYHKRSDLMKFPDFGKSELLFEARKNIQHPLLAGKNSILEQIATQDILLHFPYHNFSHIIQLLAEAAIDPLVKTIRICLYRVAHNSQIVNALVNAARNGKRVIAVVELQARFDEEHNIAISKVLHEAGVRVIPGVPGLKVHSKLIQISRKDGAKTTRFVHIGSGNLNEKTATIYSDTSLLTADKDIGREVRKIFMFFESNFQRNVHRHLIVSPFNTRRRIMDLINNEIELQKKGKPGSIILKLNNLVDTGMINKLYEASKAGVHIQLIIRGICSLIPGIAGMSENIKVISVLGRYLEHSRILVFGNAGKPLYFVSSADWMTRNIDHRIELTVPISSPKLKEELQDILDIQLHEKAKYMVVDKSMKNEYPKADKASPLYNVQDRTFEYLKNKKY